MRDHKDSALERALINIVTATPWLLEVLAAVRAMGLPDSYVAAGAIRNTVWDSLHGWPTAPPSGDIDVVYFDPVDAPSLAQQLLSTRLPQYTWDVANQATIHAWQSVDAGCAISAYTSIEGALASWPETATAIAVRLNAKDHIEFVAPFGLTDLFELRGRPNPHASNPAAFQARQLEKGWLARWPRLRITPVPKHT